MGEKMRRKKNLRIGKPGTVLIIRNFTLTFSRLTRWRHQRIDDHAEIVIFVENLLLFRLMELLLLMRYWRRTWRRSADLLEPPTAANVATGPKNLATRWLGWPGIAQDRSENEP
uniref:Uncharacterized protein n=1 Tax=Romanomermis culicivorax TaxID=13658 RepID=A0A915KM51_ROMCU